MGVAVHNIMDKWESLNTKGSSIINSISNRKLIRLFGEGEEGMDSKADAASVNVPDSATQSDAVDPELESLCENLHTTCRSMEEIVDKLAVQCSVAHGLCSLSQYGDGDTSFDSVLTVSQMEDLVETLDRLCAMCKKELSLKKNVARTVVHAGSRELLMTYCAIWINQPYLDYRMLLDAILLMTGHALLS